MPAGADRTRKNVGSEKNKKVLKLTGGKSEAPKRVEPVGLPEGIDPDALVFAFDIGTRTVVGVVGFQEENRFRIIATEVVEHKSRAMLDGQIHDIDQVAAVAAEVKKRIESRLGITLKKVAIAAAGRVLKTCQVRVDRDLEPGQEIDPEMVGSLEIEGIQRAQSLLDGELPGEDKNRFYCVGFSVINYYLDGYVISKLEGHKGKSAGADILATFLPHVVVDSLYTVMSRIGLEVSNLTLEPIAAINVAIPQDLRLLNLALVDVGAGTSDIALTKGGSVIAYAMAPIAGDEITEKISQQYLADFNTSEKIKISLSSSRENINFTDILRIKHTVKAQEVMEVIRPSIEMLAATISQKILEYNHKAPNAVFLIGGGSQVPGLAETVAGYLELPRDRVVVRGRDVIRNIKFNDKKLSGPESITPYGIALTAQLHSGKDFLTVSVNGAKVKLFNSKKLNVSDALVLVGFNAGQLIGRSGRSLTFSLNGEKRTLRGEHGKAAEIFVGQKPASLETVLKSGDSITVVPAVEGRNAEIKAAEAAGGLRLGKVKLNGSTIDISTAITINGSVAAPDCQIKEGDSVETYAIRTLEDLLKAGGIDCGKIEATVNGLKAALDYQLKDADIVEYSDMKNENQVNAEKSVIAGVEACEISSFQTEAPASFAGGVWVSVNGKKLELKDNKKQYIFVDVFNYIDFDLTKPQGNIVLRLNGSPAAFTDSIRSGDNIEIYWQK